MDIKADGLGDVEQLDHIHSPTAALDGVDDGLVTSEFRGESALAQTCALALLDQNIDEAQLSRRSQGLGHEPASAPLLKPTDPVSGFTENQKIWLDGASRRKDPIMPLIEQRHPAFAQLMALWRLGVGESALPLARALAPNALAALGRTTVLLEYQGQADELTIAESGAEVDALYGAPLAGAPAARLSPDRDDAQREARVAIETGRPLLIEDELRTSGESRRVARLYLPLANDDGTPDGVLCGVVAVG